MTELHVWLIGLWGSMIFMFGVLYWRLNAFERDSIKNIKMDLEFHAIIAENLGNLVNRAAKQDSMHEDGK